MKEVIDRIKKIMAEKNITQRELAQKTGVTEVSMSRYLSDQRVPKATLIVKIAEALGTTPNYLMGIEEHKITNADRIRNMSNEELAEIINKNELVDFCQCKAECSDLNNITDEKCKACALEWLQKAADE